MSNEREHRNQVFRGEGGVDSGGIPMMSAAERLKQEFGIVIPAELARLPSDGRIYPANTPLHNLREVEIKAMSTREEDILTSAAYIKKGTVITELIRSCLIDKSIDVDSLISGDRNALMVAIRITGYGPFLKPTMTCPSPTCGEPNRPTFDLRQVQLKTLPADCGQVAEGLNEFEVLLPVSRAKATFKFLTGREEEAIIEAHERKKKMLNTVVDTLVSDTLKAQLLSVNGIRDRGKLAFFVDNMIGLDSLTIRERVAEITPGVEMKQEFSCEHCPYKEEVEIPIDRTFLWPRSTK